MDYDDEDELDYDGGRAEEKDELMDEDPPKFSLLNLEHEMDADIVDCNIQNDVVAILGKTGRIIARDDDGLISHTITSPHKLFLDPTGQHLLVASFSGELMYCSVKHKGKPCKMNVTQQAQSVPHLADTVRSQTHVIESVAWNVKNTQSSTTTSILLATRQGGLIFEACVDVSQTSASFSVLKLVYELPGEELPVVGLEADLVGNHLLVVATSLHRIYRLEYETPDAKTSALPFEKLFAQYKDTPPQLNEMPLSGDSVAKGSLFVLRAGGSQLVPQAYAWSCSVGVIHGLFNSKSLMARAERHTAAPEDMDIDEMDHNMWDDDGETFGNEQTIQFNPRHHPAGTLDRAPFDIALTQFHMFLLYDDRLAVLNVIPGMRWVGLQGPDLTDHDYNERVRFEPFKFRRVRNLKGIIRDIGARRMYVYNNISIWEIEVEDESNTQWRRFLERGLATTEEQPMRTRYLQAALTLARGDPGRRDLVAYNLGCYYLQIREFQKATETFAECNRFENIVCKLQETGKQVLVYNYLLARFRFLIKYRRRNAHVSQVACLVVFIVQLKLENITSFHGNASKQRSTCDELTAFLQEAYSADPSIFDGNFYNVIARTLQAHGRMSVMLTFAEAMNHVHYTVHHHVSMENYKEACTVLNNRCRKDPNYAPVWYEFAPAIICDCPVALVTGMLKAVVRNEDTGKVYPILKTEKLIPAFLNYDVKKNENKSDEHEVMLYIQSMISRYEENSPVVHDYYLSLLVEQLDPTELEDFLESSEYYNKEYGLRLCLERKKLSQCVYLYKELSHYEEAVEVALYTNALDKAKDIATEVSEGDMLDYATLKKLWLLIVEHVIKKYGTGQALLIIDESNGILKMEDVLGQFSDDTVIRDFKDAVCKALDEYAAEIRTLKDGMNEATETARMIKEDTQALRHRFGFITTTQRCELCERPLLASANPFLVYPSCRHVFHEHCVVNHLIKVGGIGAFRNSGVNGLYLADAQVESLEDLAAVECVLCGESAVLEIAQPFFSDEDPSWDILLD